MIKKTFKPIIVKNSSIAKILKVEGIVLYPFVFFASANPERILVDHEMIHVGQIQKEGCFKFYFLYLVEYIKLRLDKKNHHEAYRSISYEIEAYNGSEKIHSARVKSSGNETST